MSRKGASPPRTLTPQQVEAMLASTCGSSIREVRDRAIVDLIYSTAMRVSEVAQLVDSQVQLDAGNVAVPAGASSKARLLPVGRLTRSSLRQWLTARAELLAGRKAAATEGGSFFRNLRDYGPLGARSIQRIVERVGLEVGIAKVTPGALRRSCAAHMSDRGASLEAIHELLGHADMGSTAEYARSRPTRVRAAHRTAHPRG